MNEHVLERSEKRYPIPDQEAERLRALHEFDILDTVPDEQFDRLTDIAETQLNVPIAAITFIDSDRQFFKACSGTDASGTRRDESFCTYTILEDGVMVVEDTWTDDRFGKDYLRIDGTEVRSYAGAPLTTNEGHNLGSFCVLGFEPRSFSSKDLDLLKLLRDQTISLLRDHKNQKNLTRLAHYDTMTGFPKRHRFQEQLETHLQEARSAEQMIGVAHLDITHFRRISETLGYEAQEEVLQQVAARLRESLPTDAVMTRVNGDEFLIALMDLRDEQSVRDQLAEAIQQLREPITVGPESFLFSARAGVAFYPSTGQDVNSLLRQANAALKESTPEDATPVTRYLDDMATNGNSPVTLESDFERALRSHSLSIHYQPQVNLSDRSVAGAEALIRWNHPEVGFVAPPVIISLAETLGKMGELGRWILRTVSQQVHQWNQRGNQDLKLGVNVSALEFQQADSLLQSVDSVLEETGLPAGNLELEITETEAAAEFELLIELLHELNDRGVGTAIDDYGTGQSSLEYLAQFPDPTLKIDRAFIDGVTEDQTRQSIVQNTINMAQDLNLSTIA